jgi:hypothetical protein
MRKGECIQSSKITTVCITAVAHCWKLFAQKNVLLTLGAPRSMGRKRRGFTSHKEKAWEG